MKKLFGVRSDGQNAYLYTISGGGITAEISDHGATLVKLWVPDHNGKLDDVVLGYDTPDEYTASGEFFGATVGRVANRIGGAEFTLNGRTFRLDPNDNDKNCLHGGFDPYKNRMWKVVRHEESAICMSLDSPDGDQGYPGNAHIELTFSLEAPGTLSFRYDVVCDKDTLVSMTHHGYFNLAGHQNPEKAMDQILSMPARFFTPADAESIPTGEKRDVAGTPMDFRTPKALGRDINEDYDALNLQGGYDHNFEVFTAPCAILSDPMSGRSMAVVTDLPGVQLYSGNFLCGDTGKDGISYCKRSGVCLETQYYPDAIHNPEWPQPILEAGKHWRSETKYLFTW